MSLQDARVVFMGSPRFAVPSLEYLIRARYRIAAVYTQPDRPAGRGRILVAPPVKESAVKYGLEVRQPENFKTAGAISQLKELNPDAIVVAAFGQILPQAVLDIPCYGCINIHPSLLPKYRGASPVAAAILAADEFSGVSIMLLDAGTDTGPLLSRAAVNVSPHDDTGTLTEKLSFVGAMMLGEALAGRLRGEIEPRPQDEVQATYSAPITKEEGEIDWHRAAPEIWRRVRAFNPWPGCFTRWRGRQLKVLEAVPLGGGVEAGRVVALTGRVAVGIGTGVGVLGLVRIQLEGKRVMPADEFLRGQRDFIGSLLPG